MTSLPKPLQKTIEFFERFPSIGPKTARRLAFFLLKIPQKDLEEYAVTLMELKKKSLFCTTCFNLTEESVCAICQDRERDRSTIAVVEDVLDLLSMETGNQYKGVYHVLHGRIDPLNYVGPEDIYIDQLIRRVQRTNGQLQEIILATNPNVEGEATAMYIRNKLKMQSRQGGTNCKISRLAYGLPMGADLEYADYMTLQRAMEGRREY